MNFRAIVLFFIYTLHHKPAAVATGNYASSIPAYASSIREYASCIPELRRLHNSRMVYTKHPVWYIPNEAFTIYCMKKGRKFAVAPILATDGNMQHKDKKESRE